MSIVSNFPAPKVATKDNLTTTTAGFALDARQGKILKDMITGTEVETSLTAVGWVGDAAPYTYNLAVSSVTATSENDLYLALGVTKEQLNVAQKANIIDGGQSNGTIILKAYGDKPTIDIPIRVYVKGE